MGWTGNFGRSPSRSKNEFGDHSSGNRVSKVATGTLVEVLFRNSPGENEENSGKSIRMAGSGFQTRVTLKCRSEVRNIINGPRGLGDFVIQSFLLHHSPSTDNTSNHKRELKIIQRSLFPLRAFGWFELEYKNYGKYSNRTCEIINYKSIKSALGQRRRIKFCSRR